MIEDSCFWIKCPDFFVLCFGLFLFQVLESVFFVFTEEPFDESNASFCPIVAALCLFEKDEPVFSLEGFRMIGLGSRENVTAVFDNIFIRNIRCNDSSPIEVTPVFPVVLVPFGVMEGNKRKSVVFFSFFPDRRVNPLIIPARWDELCQGELR